MGNLTVRKNNASGAELTSESRRSLPNCTWGGALSGQRTFNCNGKIMPQNLVIGSRTLKCNGKIMPYNVWAEYIESGGQDWVKTGKRSPRSVIGPVGDKVAFADVYSASSSCATLVNADGTELGPYECDYLKVGSYNTSCGYTSGRAILMGGSDEQDGQESPNMKRYAAGIDSSGTWVYCNQQTTYATLWASTNMTYATLNNQYAVVTGGFGHSKLTSFNTITYAYDNNLTMHQCANTPYPVIWTDQWNQLTVGDGILFINPIIWESSYGQLGGSQKPYAWFVDKSLTCSRLDDPTYFNTVTVGYVGSYSISMQSRLNQYRSAGVDYWDASRTRHTKDLGDLVFCEGGTVPIGSAIAVTELAFADEKLGKFYYVDTSFTFSYANYSAQISIPQTSSYYAGVNGAPIGGTGGSVGIFYGNYREKGHGEGALSTTMMRFSCG